MNDTAILLVGHGSRNRDGNAEIYRMNPDGSGQLRLTSFHLDDWSPQWAPDAQTIAFLSNREQIDRIFLMRPDGGDQRPHGPGGRPHRSFGLPWLQTPTLAYMASGCPRPPSKK